MHRYSLADIFSRPFAFVLLAVMAGCVAGQASILTEQSGQHVPVQTVPGYGQQAETATIQITNTAVSATPTRTIDALSTKTPMPQPTLAPEEAKTNILQLLKENGGCRLPCVWGVDPAISTLSSVIRFTDQFGRSSKPGEYDISTFGDVTAIFWKGNLRAYTNFGPSARKGNLAYLSLYAEFTQEQREGGNLKIRPVYGNPFFTQLIGNFLLPKILSDYGEPSQVMIMPFYDDPDAPNDVNSLFSLVLVYQKQGFLIEYLLLKEKGPEDYLGCPSKAAYLSLITWDPQNQPALEDIVLGNSGLGINSDNFSQFKSLEEATTLTKDSFLHTFSNENSHSCLETPQELWGIP